MRRSILLLALLAVASPAHAYFLNRNPAIGSNAANGKTPQTAWRTIAYANANLPSDSSMIVAANDTLYDEPINPVGFRTTWRGDTANFRAVRIPGASLYTPGNIFLGMSFWGSVKCNDSQYKNGRDQFFRKCGIYGFLYAKSSRQGFYNCEIGSSNVPNFTYIWVNPDFSNGDSVRFINNTMFLKNGTAGTGDFLLNFEPDHWAPPGQTDPRTMDRWTVTGNRCTLTTVFGSVIGKTTMFNHLTSGLFDNNVFFWRDSSGSTTTGASAFLVRDSVSRNVFSNNTFEINSLIPGTGQLVNQIYSSGSRYPDSGNVYRDNTFKSNVSNFNNGSAVVTFQWQVGGRDSILRNKFISNTAFPACYFGDVKPGDSCFVRNNLFANLNGGPGLLLELASCAWGTGSHLDLRGNIFYGPRTTDGVLRIGYDTNIPDAIYSNNNLFWSPRSAARAEFIGSCSGAEVPVPIGTHSLFDINSTYGCPVFADSAYDTFDATVACNSAAISAGPWGTDAGPVAYDANLCAPSPIADLRGIGSSSNEVILQWTSPGDKGDVGQATLYSLRYSTAPIDAGNFAAADTVAFPGVYYPKTAGSAEGATVSGLSAATTYYFAIKARGSVGVYSGISNLPSYTTRNSNSLGHAEP